MKRWLILALIVAIGVGSYVALLQATTTVLADCEEGTLQTWHDAASDGDVAQIPAGTCTWSTTVELTKSVEIEGVGGRGTKTQCEVGSQTTYTCIKGNNKLLVWTTEATGSPRLAGITFYGESCSNCSGSSYDSQVRITGSNGRVRVHDLVIDNAATGYTTLIIAGNVRGVGWNNDCVKRAQAGGLCWLVYHDNWMDDTGDFFYGGRSWSEPSTIGTDQAWYWEDNTFGIDGFSNNGYATDDFAGARVVYRFNTLTNISLQNHGTETGGRTRGHREVDYYRNVATNTLEAWPGAFAFRGGSGQCWGNSFITSGSGSYTRTCEGNTFRRDDSSHGDGSYYNWNACGIKSVTSISRSGTTATVTQTAHQVSGSGSYVTIAGVTGGDAALYNGTFLAFRASDTTYTYTMAGTPSANATGTITAMSPFDGNADATGWRCLDGFGVGQSPYITGEAFFDNLSPLTGYPSAQQPVRGWSNLLNGSQTDVTASMDFVQANRDLFNENDDYNGSTERGIFVGTALPGDCTDGDGAWITDEGDWNTETSAMHANHGSNHTEGEDGTLYECVSDAWTPKYGVNSTGEPVDYPHPLRAEAASSPTAPSRLRFRIADAWVPSSLALLVFLRRRRVEI